MKHSGRCRLSHHRRRRGATYGRASAGGLASYRYRHRNAGTAIHRGCRQLWAAALQLREVVAERHIPQAGNKRVAPPRRPEHQKPSRECRLRYLRPHAPWQPWRPSLQAPQRQPAGSVSWYSPVVKSMFPFWRKFRLQLQKALPKRLQNATMSILCQGMFTFHYSIHPACGSGTLDKAVCPPCPLCFACGTIYCHIGNGRHPARFRHGSRNRNFRTRAGPGPALSDTRQRSAGFGAWPVDRENDLRSHRRKHCPERRQ